MRTLVTFLITLILVGVAGAGVYFLNKQNQELISLQGQVSQLQREVGSARIAANQNPGLPQTGGAATTRSQEQILTDLVATAAPSVVSIVVSKEVPKLDVTYINPFGDNPFFGGLGFKIPVYQRKGMEKERIAAGTGFIISSQGHILTNKHVVEETGAEYTVLLSDGSQKNAAVTYRDDEQDVALLKIDGSGYKSLPLGNSDDAKLGQTVVAIGNALGEYNNSISVGIVSGLNRSIRARDENGDPVSLDNVLQTDAAINLGNSGGPLIDLTGKVIGINIAIVANSNNISFAIPIDAVKDIVSTIR